MSTCFWYFTQIGFILLSVVLRASENKFQDERSTANEDSIHIVVMPFIFLGQCFGLLPVNGVLNSTPENLT